MLSQLTSVEFNPKIGQITYVTPIKCRIVSADVI